MSIQKYYETFHCKKCNRILSNVYLWNLDRDFKIDNEARTNTFKCSCGNEITIPLCPYYNEDHCTYWWGCVMGFMGLCTANIYSTNDKFANEVAKEHKKAFYAKMRECFTFKKHEYHSLLSEKKEAEKDG